MNPLWSEVMMIADFGFPISMVILHSSCTIWSVEGWRHTLAGKGQQAATWIIRFVSFHFELNWNQLMASTEQSEASGNSEKICVAIRMRPLNEREKNGGQEACFRVNNEHNSIVQLKGILIISSHLTSPHLTSSHLISYHIISYDTGHCC